MLPSAEDLFTEVEYTNADLVCFIINVAWQTVSVHSMFNLSLLNYVLIIIFSKAAIHFPTVSLCIIFLENIEAL